MHTLTDLLKLCFFLRPLSLLRALFFIRSSSSLNRPPRAQQKGHVRQRGAVAQGAPRPRRRRHRGDAGGQQERLEALADGGHRRRDAVCQRPQFGTYEKAAAAHNNNNPCPIVRSYNLNLLNNLVRSRNGPHAKALVWLRDFFFVLWQAFIETSANEGSNVETAFHNILTEIYHQVAHSCELGNSELELSSSQYNAVGTPPWLPPFILESPRRVLTRIHTVSISRARSGCISLLVCVFPRVHIFASSCRARRWPRTRTAARSPSAQAPRFRSAESPPRKGAAAERRRRACKETLLGG